MSLSNDFYLYARQGEQNRQRLGYYGAKVNVYQEGQPGEPGYIPADITTGLIDQVVVYPDLRTGLDVPGRSGGDALDFDNSLSIHGTTFPPGISAPMNVVVTAPDHTISTPTETLIDYDNLRNEDQGEVGTVTVELVIPPSNTSLIENLANLQPIDATFEYWNGSSYVAVEAVRRWDLANVITFDVTLDTDPVGQLKIRTTFGTEAVEGDYRYVVSMVANGVKRFTAQDDFAVSV
jgi:hypothetical protein